MQTSEPFFDDLFSFSETKRNTAQNESLGESPLATVSLRFVKLTLLGQFNKVFEDQVSLLTLP